MIEVLKQLAEISEKYIKIKDSLIIKEQQAEYDKLLKLRQRESLTSSKMVNLEYLKEDLKN